MSTAQNKALANRMVERLFNQHDLSVADDVIAADALDHEELPPGMPPGREGTKAMFAMMFSAFPDFQATIQNLIAEDDKVVVHMLWTGTHKGELMGIPPTGKQVTVTGARNGSPESFETAAALLSKRLLNVRPLIQQQVPLDNVKDALELAIRPDTYRVIVTM